MDIKQRITLLDDLLVLNQEVGLSEDAVAGLVDFLATMDDAQREAVLEYIREGDRFNRFERFAQIANLPEKQRAKLLKAMGLRPTGKKSLLHELFGSAKEGTHEARQVINDLAEARKTFEEGFFEPLMHLFCRRKTREGK